jgi:ribonuclease HII
MLSYKIYSKNKQMGNLITFFKENQIEAGCDEAGRGCLAGPVVAASVILNLNQLIEGLNDSKKLSEKSRNQLQIEIKANVIDYAIGVVDEKEIDDDEKYNDLRIDSFKTLPPPLAPKYKEPLHCTYNLRTRNKYSKHVLNIKCYNIL